MKSNNNNNNNSNRKLLLKKEPLEIDDIEATTSAFGNMVGEAIARISDESDDQHQYASSVTITLKHNINNRNNSDSNKINRNNNNNEHSSLPKNGNTIGSYDTGNCILEDHDDIEQRKRRKEKMLKYEYGDDEVNNVDDDEEEVDDDDEDDEKQCLLRRPSIVARKGAAWNHHGRQRQLQHAESHLQYHHRSRQHLHHQHHLQQQQQQRQQQWQYDDDDDDDDDDVIVVDDDDDDDEKNADDDGRQQQGAGQQRQQRQQPYRANKCGAEHIASDIVNQYTDTMGLTPPNSAVSAVVVAGAAADQITKKRSICSINWYIYLVTTLSAIGGFLFGYDTGIVSGAMVFIKDYFELNTLMQEIVISVTILTAWIFSFIAGYLTNKFGRKLVIMLASFVFTIGGLMMALSHTEYVLLMGRAIIGLAIGLASMAIPVYIAEVAPVQLRGKLVSTNVCFITFGQFVASIVAGLFSSDKHNGWRWMLGLASVPSFLQLVFFFFLPESPRWLVQKQRYDEAYEALFKFRYADTMEAEIKSEFDTIKENCLNSERERKNSKSIRTLLANSAIVRALFVGSLLSIFQQVAGINTVMYYSATIIQMSGINDKSTAVWLSALTASINFVFSFVGLVLVERLGRRILTLTSLCGVVFSLLILAAGFQLAELNSPPVSFQGPSDPVCSQQKNCDQCLSSKYCGYCFYENNGSHMFGTLMMSKFNGTCLLKNSTQHSHSPYCNSSSNDSMMWTTNWCPSQYSWMTLAGLMLYLLFFAPGMGPMPWTINSEIYPLWARSFCYSVSTSFNWFFNLLVSLTFLTLTNLLTIYGAFYLYAGLALLGLILFFFMLPETKGKSLEEIETLFQGPLCRISNNTKNLSQYDHVDGSVNASQSTVLTSSTTSSTVKM